LQQLQLASRCRQRILDSVKAKKSARSKPRRKTAGTKLVEKYRPKMSRLTDEERQTLMARGLQLL